jgi:aspartate kinase
MVVYKFGGASVRDADAVRNVVSILRSHAHLDKVVVISAMGKTTNALEQIIAQYLNVDIAWEQALDMLLDIHLGVIHSLYGYPHDTAYDRPLRDIVDAVRVFLRSNSSTSYHYIYDQVVSAGEYLSTTLVSLYCQQQGMAHTLLDAKTCIYTDEAYTEGLVQWSKTEQAITSRVPSIIDRGFVMTQGFIGCAPSGHTTTLGREGSDYTAAIFSHCLNAERMVVWKDVPGIMNADPKLHPDAQRIDELSYLEAIEMTYYGASVIHPKTIKPLQNRHIPMEVRSFIHPDEMGSIISATASSVPLPPIIIHKEDQMLLSFSARDFSFIAEEHLTQLFAVFAAQRLRINLMQNAAISFSICVDNKQEKIAQVIETLKGSFEIRSNEHLSLLTIRHYDDRLVERLTAGKKTLLRQASRHTIQVLMQSATS